MSSPRRPLVWPLSAVLLALVLAFDLGARSRAAPGAGLASDHLSLQIEVTDDTGQLLLSVPLDRTFVLKDLVTSNGQANAKKLLNVGANIYPTLKDAKGEVKLAGTNLMDWAKGNNNSTFGGGRSGFQGSPLRSQTGLIGLSGGVVFEPGSQVFVHDYIGALYLDGVLLP